MNLLNRLQRKSMILMLLLTIVLVGSGIFYLYRHRQRIYQQRLEAEARAIPDTLRVVTVSGATTYFNYKGEDMGFQYDLVSLFADSIGRPFRLIVARDIEQAQQMIDSLQADICITPIAETQSGKDRFLYAGYTGQEGLVLVQRRQTDSTYIHNVTELLDKKVTVLADSRYERRLKAIEEQLGGDIDIQSVSGDTINSEDLMVQVATSQIDYTVASEELALLTRTYYPNIDVRLQVGFKQRLRWVVPHGRIGLAEALDKWWAHQDNTQEESVIYKRYFDMLKATDGSESHPATSSTTVAVPSEAKAHLGKGKISPYDQIFSLYAPRIGWDAKMLASIAYQESNFKADVVGWSGARGLMGIMPRTGKIYGANKQELLNPEVSVRVAISCLLDIRKIFSSVPDVEQQQKMILAGYNAGPAHIQDAQRLAKKYGYNPMIWEGNVEEFVRLKSDPKYYNDPVCKYGYLRGRETIKYVREVMERYRNYQQKYTN